MALPLCRTVRLLLMGAIEGIWLNFQVSNRSLLRISAQLILT